MTGFELRAPRDDDIGALVTLGNEDRVEAGQQATATADEIRVEWGMPSFDRERHARVAVAGDAIVGQIMLWKRSTWIFADGYVARAARGRGIGSAMLDWATDVARSEPDVTELHVNALDRRPDSLDLITSRPGFSYVRSFFWMLHRAPLDVAATPLPSGIGIVPLEGDELADAACVAHDASFIDHWNYTPAKKDDYVHWMTADPNDDPALWLIAKGGDAIAGFCVAYLEGPEDERLGVIAELGTSRRFRGIGLGRALLTEGIRRLAERGARTVGLGVDGANPTGALALYRSTGFAIEHENKRFRLIL